MKKPHESGNKKIGDTSDSKRRRLKRSKTHLGQMTKKKIRGTQRRKKKADAADWTAGPGDRSIGSKIISNHVSGRKNIPFGGEKQMVPSLGQKKKRHL